MKLAFYVLLLANIVFYLWETGGNRPPSNVDRIELQLPESAEQIRLLKELPVIPKRVPAAAVETRPPESSTPEETGELPPGVSLVTPSDSPSPAADPFCYVYGPYGQAGKAQAVLDAHQAKLQEASVVTMADVVAEGYWVLFPKAENIYAARANRKMLMEKGVQDAWVFDKGEMAGAISLGVFNSRDKADLMQEQLRAKGIEVEVKPRLARSDAFWVQVSWKNGRETLSKLLPDEGGLTLKSCVP